MNGDIQIGVAIMMISTDNQTSNNGTEPQIRCPGLPPSMLTKMLDKIRLTRCPITTATKVINGIATMAVNSLEITVSASVTGNERQNRMLLFFRSAYSESRH
jgi:hypothetical protein